MADDVQERSIANLQYQIQKKRNELEWEKDRITQLEKELASSKSKCIRYENKIRIMKKDFSLLNSDHKELKHQIRASEASIKRLTKDSLEKKRKEEEYLGKLYCYIDAARSMANDIASKAIHTKCVLCGDEYCQINVEKTTKDEQISFKESEKEWKNVDPLLL